MEIYFYDRYWNVQRHFQHSTVIWQYCSEPQLDIPVCSSWDQRLAQQTPGNIMQSINCRRGTDNLSNINTASKFAIVEIYWNMLPLHRARANVSIGAAITVTGTGLAAYLPGIIAVVYLSIKYNCLNRHTFLHDSCVFDWMLWPEWPLLLTWICFNPSSGWKRPIWHLSLSQNAAKIRKINRLWPKGNQFQRWSGYISRLVIRCPVKCGTKSIIHLQTSMVSPLKFGNCWVILFHTS